MLVSSIGYFDNRNSVIRDSSVNNKSIKSDMNYGFGHDNSENLLVEKNIFSRVIDSVKSLFSAEKQDKKDNSFTVMA